MPTKTWKAIEGYIAKLFGSTRTPLSGGNGKQTRSDTLHPRIFIELKYGRQSAWIKLFQETAELADREGKFPIVVLVAKGDRTPYVLAPLDELYLAKLLEELRAAKDVI